MAQSAVERIIDIPTHLDHQLDSLAAPARELVDSAGLSPQEWQGLPLLVNLPSLNVIAAIVLAELHGRMGYFPTVLRLRPIPDIVPPQFEVAEILKLHEIREKARAKR